MQQLKTIKNIPVYYWVSESGNAEVDFIIQIGRDVIPVEVKAGINLQAKSLKVYREKYSPRLAVRTANVDLKNDDGLLNIPLYLIGAASKIISVI